MARDLRGCLLGLWREADLGVFSHEAAAWVIRRSDGRLDLFRWASRTGAHQAVWRGTPPAGALAIVHTHAQGDGPRPSTGDSRVSASLGIPVMVVTRAGLWTALPDGQTVQDAAEGWYRNVPRGCAGREADIRQAER